MESKGNVKPKLGYKNKCSAFNGLENGSAVDCHNADSEANLLSGPECKYYKSNGDSDKSTLLNGCKGTVNMSETNGVDVEKSIMITDELVRNKAFKWCQDCLGGSWSQLSSKEDLIIAPICGGTTNYLYLISLPPSHPPINCEPAEVILRMYGEVINITKDFLLQNSIVFVILAAKQLGPKPYGIYHDGRIEEFIKAEPLSHCDLRRPEIMSLSSKKLALFHNLSMPLSKKPLLFKDMVGRWLKAIVENKVKLEPTLAEIKKLNSSMDLEKDYELLIKMGNDLQASVVFCHNDYQSGNLLYQPPSANKPAADMVVIDTEYASYNYRGFDIANHFVEWSFDLTVGGMPGFLWHPERFPTKDQQFSFFKSYLQATGIEDITEEALEKIYKETIHFVLYSHFLWGCWSLTQYLSSTIEFDYKAYAVCRFEGYCKHKEWLEAKYGKLGGEHHQ